MIKFNSDTLVIGMLDLYFKILNFNSVFKLVPFFNKILLYNSDTMKKSKYLKILSTKNRIQCNKLPINMIHAVVTHMQTR